MQKPRNPIAKSLQLEQYRHRVVKDKKKYNRKKEKKDVEREEKAES